MKDFLKNLPKKLQNNLVKNKLLYTVLFFCFLLVVSVICNLAIQGYLNANYLLPNPFPNFKVADYPFLKSSETLDVSAWGVIVMDDNSKVIVLSKIPNLRFSLASTTKIMTALIALEYYKPNDILTIKADSVEGSIVGFKKGEKISFESLLYAMLLPSSNDAALAIAQNFEGGEKEFIKKMNQKALSLYLFNTHFSDSYGLNDSDNYTTVFDLAQLASYASKNPIISDIVSTKIKIISNADNTNRYLLKNLNKLLGIYGVNGIKTGYTEAAGLCLVTYADNFGHEIVAVVLESNERKIDMIQILDYSFGRLGFEVSHPLLSFP